MFVIAVPEWEDPGLEAVADRIVPDLFAAREALDFAPSIALIGHRRGSGERPVQAGALNAPPLRR